MSYINAESLVAELRKYPEPNRDMPIEFKIVSYSYHALADAIEKAGS